MLRWLALCLLVAAPVAAQESCGYSDVSRLFRDGRPLPQLLVAISFRKECGLIAPRDVAALQSLHVGRGCSVNSDVGQYFREIIERPLTPTTRHPGIHLLRRDAPEDYALFCRMAEAVPWPKGSSLHLTSRLHLVSQDHLASYQAFWAHLDAMTSELTRAVTALRR